jgi:spore coat polysaccharide biosynthesis protein SpsF
MLELVLESCSNTARYINSKAQHLNISVNEFLLIPETDTSLMKKFCRNNYLNIVTGGEQDVLGRYYKTMDLYSLDYIVRITSDCPLVPTNLITQIILKGVDNKLDYLTNTMPGFETYFDGADVEFISRNMLEWLNDNATGSDREHVTTLIKSNLDKLRTYNIAHVFSRMDMSRIKLSVDTHQDLERVRDVYGTLKEKEERWSEIFGSQSVFRL